MRHPLLQLVMAISFYLFSLEAAFALSLELVDKLDIKAIKSINLIKTDDEFRATVVVQFSTAAEVGLKFRNPRFVITFEDGKGTEIYLGTTQQNILFPASEDGSEKIVEKELDVFVGKNDVSTTTRLIELFNLIGNPGSEFAMRLSGTTNIGTKAKRGWLYHGEVEIEDFTFHPTIQREVLFK
ncbi:MAG: hypothetical protein DRR19_16465 [Candidatus Parabeggiatoa sp. nov. 1]|nr:MAG: hypothetical protein DRR19_16465 [Gammaproteobacteria bacterium]